MTTAPEHFEGRVVVRAEQKKAVEPRKGKKK
jgi:hypothetical protein